MSQTKSRRKFHALTCHAFHNGLKIWFAVFWVLSGGTVQYALYVTKAQATRTDISSHAAIRIVMVFNVNRLRLVFFAVVRICAVLEWRWFQIAGQHYFNRQLFRF